MTITAGSPIARNHNESARVCDVCRWRILPEHRARVCWPCAERMERQLSLLGRVTRLLAVVARSEPTPAGTLNLPVVDLTLPGAERPIVGPPQDQLGEMPIAARLADWWNLWTGRDVWTADAGEITNRLIANLHQACEIRYDIAEFAYQLRQAYGSTRRALGRDLRPVRYLAPCPGCGAAALRRYPGDWIECQECQRLWDDPDLSAVNWGEYLWLRQHVNPWTPLDSQSAATYAGVSLEVLRKWVQRDQLSPIRPVPKAGHNLAPKFWPLEIDRCKALLEDRGRRAEAQKTHATQEETPACAH